MPGTYHIPFVRFSPFNGFVGCVGPGIPSDRYLGDEIPAEFHGSERTRL